MRLAALLLLLASPALAAGSVHPLKGQNAAQQAGDVRECEAQATKASGYDPANPPPGLMAGAAKGAAVGAATGALTGNATSGATTGAATAAMKARSDASAKQAAFDKERAACLTARGYR